VNVLKEAQEIIAEYARSLRESHTHPQSLRVEDWEVLGEIERYEVVAALLGGASAALGIGCVDLGEAYRRAMGSKLNGAVKAGDK
jgi:hypothetical protein